MYDEDDLLPLSALQHLAFCERQCALIHVEGAWAENRLTALGRQLHQRTHDGPVERRAGVLIARGLPIRSLRLGLSGKADVVEFPSRDPPPKLPEGLEWLDEEPGRPDAGEEEPPSAPFPVEYKRGRPKPDRCDEVQLCAQAMCLEEMLGVTVPAGAIYYGQPRRRHQVAISDDLRRETERLAARLHELVGAGVTPPAVYRKVCRSCSLVDLCLPRTTSKGRSARNYLAEMLAAAAEDPEEVDGEAPA